MNQPIVLGIGSGRCRTFSLMHILNKQPDVQVSHEDPPLLPWDRTTAVHDVLRERFGSPMLPYFYPMLHEYEDGTWYLAEDYAFCQRARRCGFKIMADTSIRLWHIGNYSYSWEDAGIGRDRFDTFTLNFG